MMPDRPLPAGLVPRGLSADEAADYCGVSRGTLLAEVDAGRAPRPIQIRSRRVWLRDRLDAWLDGLAGGATIDPSLDWQGAVARDGAGASPLR